MTLDYVANEDIFKKLKRDSKFVTPSIDNGQHHFMT